MTSLPFASTCLPATVALSSGVVTVAKDGGTTEKKRSLTASSINGKAKAVVLRWLSLGRESNGTRLNDTLSRARVDDAAHRVGASNWPSMGHTLPEALSPADLGVGQRPPSVFFCFFLGTGDC